MKKLFALFAIALLSYCAYGQPDSKKLSLHDAIELGLTNNPSIKGAIENISASKGRYLSGISLPQPDIGVSYEYIPVNSGINNHSERTFEIRQSFEFPSIYFLKGEKFGKEEEIAFYKLKLIERSIVNQIQTNYYKILAKQFLVKSAEENLLISEQFFKKTEIRHNVGEGTNIERLTAKVQFTEARNNLEVLKNELKTAFAELNYSLGYGNQNYNSVYKLTDSLFFEDIKLDMEQISKSIQETNPQIRIAQLNNGISSVENKLAWSSLLPNFNLAYFKQMRDGNNGFYGASFGISVPLWFMFEQKGKIQEANANLSISESELQLAKNEITLKLRSSFTDYENNQKLIKLYTSDLLPQAEEIYRTVIKSYDAGELTYLDYLLAKQTLTNSRNSYIKALFDYYQSVFRIEEIVGQNKIEKSELEK